jgi:tetratricopeptide (TPR) repeat protein
MKLFDQSLEELIHIAEQSVYEGNHQQAIKLLESGLEDEPGYPKLHYTLAWMYHHYIQNKAMAERHYQLAIYFDASYQEAYEDLADLYYYNKKLRGLKTLMNQARKTPELKQDFVNIMLGKMSEVEGNYRAALRYYRKALLVCMDNDVQLELRQNIKRAKFKRLKKSWRIA